MSTRPQPLSQKWGQVAHERLAEILDSAAEGIYGLDAHGRVTFVNRAAETLTGWTAKEQLGRGQHDLIHHSRADGAPYPSAECPILRTLTDGRVRRVENDVFWTRDGEPLPVAYTSAPLYDGDGRISGVVVTFTEMGARLEERRYRSLVAATSHFVWRCDAAGVLAEVDGSWLELIGLSRADAVGGGWIDSIHADDRDLYRRQWAKAVKRCVTFACEYRLRVADGRECWFSDRAVPVQDDAGGVFEWIGATQDITDRKRIELEVRQERERYRALVESTSAILWEGDPDTFRFTFVSAEAEKLLGYPARRWVDEPDFWVRHIHPDDREWVPEYCAEATAQLRKHTFDYRMLAADGRTVWLRDVISVVVENGRPVKLVGVMVEITAMKEAEAALEYVSGLQEVLVGLSQRFILSESELVDDLINDALGRVGEYCEVDRSYLFHFRPGLDFMDNTHEWCAQGIAPEIRNLQNLPRDAVPNVVDMMERGEVMHIPRVSDLGPDWRNEKEIFEQQDIRSIIVVPVASKSGLVGFIGFDSVRRERRWNDDEIRLLQGLADVIGASLQRDAAERALRESETIRSNAENLARLGSWEWNIAEDRFVASAGWCRVTGCDRRVLTRDEVLVTVHPEDLSLVQRELQATVEHGRPYDTEHRIVRQDTGEVRWIRAYAEASPANAPPEKIWGFSQDITERRVAEEEAGRLARRLTNTLESITDAFYTLDHDWRFKYLNKEAERVLMRKRGDLVGRVIWEEFADLAGTEVERQYRRALSRGRTADFEFFYPLLNSWFETHAYPSEEGLAVYFRNINERKKVEAEVEFLALYDPVTHLPNRRLLTDRLHTALATSRRTGRPGAVLFLDLDNFKTLNDTLGHDMGDRLLQQVAARVGACVRRNDTVARFGGDEFAVILGDVGSDEDEAAVQARKTGQKILDSLVRPYRLGEHERYSTVSIGITLFGAEEDTPDEVLKRADLAMYQAKNAGRGTLRVFDPSMRVMVNSRAALEESLRDALKRGEILPYYQPQVDQAGRLIGAEALARWRHPDRGLINSMEFIPTAEETGLILELGDVMLESVCNQIVVWAERPAFANLKVAVNVSARQFHHPDFVNQVQAVMQRTGVNPENLRLELTESLMLADMEDTSAKMSALKAWGIGFSLDDFGTGYSSLVYLKNLPLDQIKIDSAFIRDMTTDASDEAIVRTIIVLARSLGLEVIAEGVETEEARALLQRHGCTAYQGFMFSPPLTAREFDRYLQGASE